MFSKKTRHELATMKNSKSYVFTQIITRIYTKHEDMKACGRRKRELPATQNITQERLTNENINQALTKHTRQECTASELTHNPCDHMRNRHGA